jgi:hypothetical protein
MLREDNLNFHASSNIAKRKRPQLPGDLQRSSPRRAANHCLTLYSAKLLRWFGDFVTLTLHNLNAWDLGMI